MDTASIWYRVKFKNPSQICVRIHSRMVLYYITHARIRCILIAADCKNNSFMYYIISVLNQLHNLIEPHCGSYALFICVQCTFNIVSLRPVYGKTIRILITIIYWNNSSIKIEEERSENWIIIIIVDCFYGCGLWNIHRYVRICDFVFNFRLNKPYGWEINWLNQ